MTSLGDAFAAIESGAADDFVMTDGFREYRFDGFSIIVDARGPAYDCSATRHEIEDLVCDNPALSALDRRLADIYRQSVTVLDGVVDSADALKHLKAEQRRRIRALAAGLAGNPGLPSQ
jgi:hypothetical protein